VSFFGGDRKQSRSAHALVQCVEVWKNSSWCALLRDELNVVDEQHIHGREAIAEAGHAVVRIEVIISLVNCFA